MKTDAFIAALAADNRDPGPRPGRVLSLGLAASVVAVGVMFVVVLGPRADFMDAARTMRFDFKFVVTLSLALSAFILARNALRPDAVIRNRLIMLALAPALLLFAVLLELFILPPGAWMANLVGHNSMLCLRMIPMLSIIPLGVMLYAFSFGAPRSPRLSGAVAGLIAAGLGAAFYAAHCPDDSPLFVAIWYSLAIAMVTGLGALLGSRFLRW